MSSEQMIPPRGPWVEPTVGYCGYISTPRWDYCRVGKSIDKMANLSSRRGMKPSFGYPRSGWREISRMEHGIDDLRWIY
jgi:hypothetical protein